METFVATFILSCNEEDTLFEEGRLSFPSRWSMWVWQLHLDDTSSWTWQSWMCGSADAESGAQEAL